MKQYSSVIYIKLENYLIYHSLNIKSVLQLQPNDDTHFLSSVLTLIAFPVSSLVLPLFIIVFQKRFKDFTSSSLVLQLFIIVSNELFKDFKVLHKSFNCS